MLTAHPAILRGLVDQYQALRRDEARLQQRIDDLAYTLCVATGTQNVDAALLAARHHVPVTRTRDDSVIDHE